MSKRYAIRKCIAIVVAIVMTLVMIPASGREIVAWAEDDTSNTSERILDEIVNPEPQYFKNGTPLDEIIKKLPATVKVRYKDVSNPEYVPVTWIPIPKNGISDGYDPNVSELQTFYIYGELELTNTNTDEYMTKNNIENVLANVYITVDDKTHIVKPIITAQPEDQTITSDKKTVTFDIVAIGDNLTYKWQVDKNDGNGFVDCISDNEATYQGEARDTLIISNVLDKMVGWKYHCIVSNDAGNNTSNPVKICYSKKAYRINITCNNGGSIKATKEPVDGIITAVEGDEVTIECQPDNGYIVDAFKVDGVVINSTVYTFSNIDSEHTVEVTFKEETKEELPVITKNPSKTNMINYNESITLHVEAKGDNLTYQWQISSYGRDYVDCASGHITYGGENTDTLTIVRGCSCMNGWKYRCKVSNSNGYVYSEYGTVTYNYDYSSINYRIDLDIGDGGDVSPKSILGNYFYISLNDTQTFTITPNEGYAVESLIIDGESVDETSSYTFTNVTTNHTLKVIFKKVSKPTPTPTPTPPVPTPEPDTEPETTAKTYDILDGADSKWVYNPSDENQEGLAIRGAGSYAKFKNIKVDGKIVNKRYYTVKEGSTIITLTPDYLETIADGDHSFEMIWTDGHAATEFTIAKSSDDSKDDNNKDDKKDNKDDSNKDDNNQKDNKDNSNKDDKKDNKDDSSKANNNQTDNSKNSNNTNNTDNNQSSDNKSNDNNAQTTEPVIKPDKVSTEGNKNVKSANNAKNNIFTAPKTGDIFLYCNSTIEELSHLSESLATTCICGTLGNYIGNALEEKYNVPYIRSINQCGITGFETWLREIGRVTDRTELVERYISEQRAIYIPQIEEVKKELNGLTAVLGMGPGYTFEVSRVLNELGIKVVWALAWHYDKKYENGDVPPSMKYLLDNDIDFETSVADQQNYEVMNVLNRYKPDMYLSRHPGSTVWAIKNGTPAVYVADEYMIFGYKHTLEFARTILDTIRNRSFEENLAKRSKLPYTDWWYTQQVDTFLEEAK